jgi:hypothetical protein
MSFQAVLLDSVLYGEVLYLSLGYLCLEPILRRSSLVDASKGSFQREMIAYNTGMCLLSLSCFICCVAALGLDNQWLQPLRDLMDSPVSALYTEHCPSQLFENKLFYYAAYAFHYSKYVEYMDTAWLVLKGKPVSFLQRFHHFGAAWNTYFGLYFRNEGYFVFLLLNSAIHTVMYAYYAYTAAGFRFQAKFLITALQITQFILGFWMVYPYIHIKCFREDSGLMFSYVFNYAYVGSVLLLFMQFFIRDNFKRPVKLN